MRRFCSKFAACRNRSAAAPRGFRAATAETDRQAVQTLLKQIQQERAVQTQVKTDAQRQYNQATFLLTVLSIILGLILAAAVTMLLLLRRAQPDRQAY